MMVSLYNCMAYMIRRLIDCTEECFYMKYCAISEEKNNQVNLILSGHFPEIIEEGNISVRLSSDNISEKYVSKLYDFTESCINEGDYILLVRLLSKLDTGLSWAISNKKMDSGEMLGLNSNSEDQQIQLLPKCYSSWAHSNREKLIRNDLNNCLCNLYYIDTRELLARTRCTVSNRFFGIYDFKRAMERGYLRIGISPMCDETELIFETKEKDKDYNEFYINGLSNVDMLTKNAESILECAKKREVDILCFPEMLGHPQIIGAIQKKLQDFPSDIRYPYPVLTICPSYWSQQSNAAAVLDGTGNEVFRQGKQFAFPFDQDGKTYIEGICPDNHIHLIHCEGIGRIGVMICRDALNSEYLHNVLSLLKVSLLFVPSFSTGHFDFENNLESCKMFDCNVFWINTCSVKKLSDKASLDKIGFVLKTGKRTSIKNGEFFFKKEKCGKLKGKTCGECLFIQKIYFDCGGYK